MERVREENSGTAASFGDLKPAAGKRILKAALIILSLFIVAGVAAAADPVDRSRKQEKAERYEISQGAQKEKGLNWAGENGELQDPKSWMYLTEVLREAAEQNPNLTVEKKEELKKTPQKDYSRASAIIMLSLQSRKQKAYDALVEACENLSEKADVSLESEVQELDVLDAFAYDHPEYYWIFYGPSYIYDETGHIYEIRMDIPDDAGDVSDKLSREAEYVVRTVRDIENT